MFAMECDYVDRIVFVSICFSFVVGATSEFGWKTRSNSEDHLWRSKKLENYLGYENCRKCHQMQVDKLVATEHFKSFETAHRSAKSKSYCKQLGIRSIKRDQRCVRCHYTPEKSTRGIRAQSGISCESCHGPARNWIQGHNDYGGLTVTKEQESVDHKNFRIDLSIEKGMRHPSNLYLLAKSCYDCHLVDDAELVNLTDHPPISNGFNMVSWSQGSMRHNFLRTDNKYNAESTPERLRVMFVVDLMAKLEATLLSLSDSQPDSEHHQFMRKQYLRTAKKLLEVYKSTNNSEIEDVISVLKKTPPNATSDQQLTAAKSISETAFIFGKNEKQHELGAIQYMLPPVDQYR